MPIKSFTRDVPQSRPVNVDAGPQTPSASHVNNSSHSEGVSEAATTVKTLPDALLLSPKDNSFSGSMIPGLDLALGEESQRPVSRPLVPEAPPPSRSKPPVDLLSSTHGIDADEEYSSDEKMLNEFTKMHPMCSMESTSVKTMQLVAGMMEKAHVVIPELPIVSKVHDDMFLSPPNVSIGERECVCGARCLAKFIARVRYGDENEKGFVCKEFLLPDQHKSFIDGNGLPPQKQKCLLCSRYYMNYIYILVRSHDAHTTLPVHATCIIPLYILHYRPAHFLPVAGTDRSELQSLIWNCAANIFQLRRHDTYRPRRHNANSNVDSKPLKSGIMQRRLRCTRNAVRRRKLFGHALSKGDATGHVVVPTSRALLLNALPLRGEH
jgi:hypothetical protein